MYKLCIPATVKKKRSSLCIKAKKVSKVIWVVEPTKLSNLIKVLETFKSGFFNLNDNCFFIY